MLNDGTANGTAPPEEVFARIAHLAHYLLGTPIVFMSHEARVFAYALEGTPVPDVKDTWSLATAVDTPPSEVNAVLDTQQDARTAHLAAVQRSGLRFYAGATLGEWRFGVAHTEAREHMSEEACAALLELAKLSTTHLSSYSSRTEAEVSQKQLEEELASVREQLELANMKLEHDTLHDMLTGLPNRKLFAEHVWAVISRLERHPKQRYAVLFLDFDDFKRVNDIYGHGVGDELLVAIAERLKRVLRPSDIVARLAGDEFTVLLGDAQEERDAVQAAERIIQAFREPLELSDQTLRLTLSIGVVLSARHYRQPEAILRDADAAMYRAKEEGGARYAVFRPALQE